MRPFFTYILPVHNEADVIQDSVVLISERLKSLGGGRIILVENASQDKSWETCKLVARLHSRDGISVFAFSEKQAGLGHAYYRGLTEAINLLGQSEQSWIILTAIDLCFLFSDLDYFLKLPFQSPNEIYMGSKANRNSICERSLKRKTMSYFFYLLRRLLLGMRTGDSQGSIFISTKTAAELAFKVQSRNYFFSTELLFYAEKAQIKINEMPVSLRDEIRPSTVRPLLDSWRMFNQILKLRLDNLFS